MLGGNIAGQEPKRLLPITSRIASEKYLRSAFGLLAAGAIYFLARPYAGIRHDGVLYAAQALQRHDPTLFANDLFFKFGSQDSFTVITSLYAWAIDLIGLPQAAMIGTLVGLLLFLCAATYLFAAIVPSSLLLFALVSISAGRFYGGWLTISFSEPFLTARLFAEAAVLLALAFAVRSMIWRALAMILVASLIHPVMAFTGGVVIWTLWCMQKPALLWSALIGVLALTLLAYFGVAPFDGLLLRFDHEWLEVVQERNEMVFPLFWEPEVTIVMMACAGILLIHLWPRRNSRLLPDRLLVAVFLCGLGGVLLSHVGADLLSNVFVTGLQPFRSLWLLQLVAMAVLVPSLVNAWRERAFTRLISLILLASCLTLAASLVTSYALLAVVVLLHLPWVRVWQPTKNERCLILGGLGLIVAATIIVAIVLSFDSPVASQDPHWTPVNAILFLTPFSAILIMLILFLGLENKRGFWLGAIGAIVLCVVAIATWDQRPPFQRTIEAAIDRPHPFRGVVGAGENVLWIYNPLLPWVVLKRPSYFTGSQGGGLLFNRGTALEYQRRSHALQSMRGAIFKCFVYGRFKDNDFCGITYRQLDGACRMKDGPRAVIAFNRLQKYPALTWDLPSGVDGPRQLHMYDCKEIRAFHE